MFTRKKIVSAVAAVGVVAASLTFAMTQGSAGAATAPKTCDGYKVRQPVPIVVDNKTIGQITVYWDGSENCAITTVSSGVKSDWVLAKVTNSKGQTVTQSSDSTRTSIASGQIKSTGTPGDRCITVYGEIGYNSKSGHGKFDAERHSWCD